MPRTPEDTRALFDRWAKTYDIGLASSKGDALGPLAGYAESLREAASLVTVTDGLRVLDVGVGTGAFAALLAERGARIIGVDPSEAMLGAGRQRHPEFVYMNGTFIDIPLDDASVDVAVSSFAFHEVPTDERVMACREIARVVKAGGSICLLDIMFASRESRDAARAAIGSRWDDDEDYPLVGELDAVLRTAGFTNTFWRQTAPCHWVAVARRT